MGRIVVSCATSVDGYLEGPGGDLSQMPLDQSFNEHNAALVVGAARLLYGATTYRGMVGYWPSQLENPDPAERSIAQRMADGIPILVVSDALGPDDTGPWRGQTTIVRRVDAHQTVADLRNEEGDTVVFGSRTLWSDLMAHGLVDVIHLLIGPKVVAGDTPAFAGVPSTGLHLQDVRRFDNSEAVLLTYSL
ncbi:deaminase [Nakamurella sp. YIM 132087]|uniref:Deaminase n=1 Tax=Nakamurella alba TaxID=2665158 RepID=A0A7K1FN45_9ACTN|nr:dihydrofolate reductase family protein [Nakamurella alba]MTD15500.1 deaminase [Nakamurella alba]